MKTDNYGSELSDCRNRLMAFQDTFSDNIARCLVEIDYYHGDQLTGDVKRQLKGRSQPEVVVNRIRVAVNGIIGVISTSQTDPKARPRTPNDDLDASLATDCLRYAADKNRFDNLKLKFAEDYLVPGTAAAIIEIDGNSDVKVNRIRWEEYFGDPRARENDYTDGEYHGIQKWMYVSNVKRMYPEHATALDSYSGDQSAGAGLFNEASEDRPLQHTIWFDRKSRRVLVIEQYYRYEGEWMHCVFFGGGMLKPPEKSAYLDEYGKTRCPIEAVSAYVDRHNQRYGHVRDMMPIQDEINKRRSKLLHLANTSQIEARDVTAIEVDADTARKEAARPDGVIPYGWQRVRTTDFTASQSALLAEAKNEIERFSPNPAMLGRQGSDTSGRALLARQQAGLVELAMLLDNFEDFECRIYRSMWLCMKQFWDVPRFIRVTKDEDTERFLQLNEPVMGQDVGMNEYGMPAVVDVVLGYKNQIAALDVDITIDADAETATIMQEMVEKLMEMVARNPAYQAEVPFEIFLELMPLPRKNQIIKKIKAFKEERQASMAAQEEEQKQIALSRESKEQDEIDSRADLNRAQASEAGVRSSTAVHKLVTDFITRNEKPGAGGKGQAAA